MEFPKNFSEMPVGPYVDIAAIHVTTRDIANMLAVAVVTGEEDPGGYERIFLLDNHRGFVLTTFCGFSAPLSLLATNFYEPDIAIIVAKFFELSGLDEKECTYLVLPEEREIMLKAKTGQQ